MRATELPVEYIPLSEFAVKTRRSLFPAVCKTFLEVIVGLGILSVPAIVAANEYSWSRYQPDLGLWLLGVSYGLLGIPMTIFCIRRFIRRLREVEKVNLEVYQENARDYEISKRINSTLPALLLPAQFPVYTSDPDVCVYRDLRLGELTRHFDRQTAGSISGWLTHRFNLAFSAYRGPMSPGSDHTTSTGSGMIAGSSSVQLSLEATTRDNISSNAFVAVLETEIVQGNVETIRLVVPGESVIHDYLFRLAHELGSSCGQGTWREEVLQKYASRLKEAILSDVTHVSDQLSAILRMAPQDRPTINVTGVKVSPHVILGATIQFGPDGQQYLLFPVGVIQALTKFVLEGVDELPIVETEEEEETAVAILTQSGRWRCSACLHENSLHRLSCKQCGRQLQRSY